MKVALGCDHGGYRLKEEIKRFLDAEKIVYQDYGCYNTEAVDYPDVAKEVGEAVAAGDFDRGMIFCGTGIGVSIVANKITGIQAALCHDTFSARATREHNNSNVLTMGERVIGFGLATDIAKIWLETEFTGGRHLRRVDKIIEIENKYKK